MPKYIVEIWPVKCETEDEANEVLEELDMEIIESAVMIALDDNGIHSRFLRARKLTAAEDKRLMYERRRAR